MAKRSFPNRNERKQMIHIYLYRLPAKDSVELNMRKLAKAKPERNEKHAVSFTSNNKKQNTRRHACLTNWRLLLCFGFFCWFFFVFCTLPTVEFLYKSPTNTIIYYNIGGVGSSIIEKKYYILTKLRGGAIYLLNGYKRMKEITWRQSRKIWVIVF